MRIELQNCVLRSWRFDDAASLAANADNRQIWLHLRDFFPYPYTEEDARQYLSRVVGTEPPTALAVEADGQACGGISASIQGDVHRLSAEIGYWLGEKHWGRGIMTACVAAFTRYLFSTFGLVRIFAVPYDNNPASCRILEKCGFDLEGRMRKSVVKNNIILDQLLYAKVIE